MKTCKGIKLLLPDFFAGELTAESQEKVRQHLAECKACNRELEILTLLAEKGRRMSAKAEEAMQSIDWESVPAKILQRLNEREKAKAPSRKPIWVQKPAFSLAASLLFFAVALWILIPRAKHPAHPDITVAPDTLDRWETSISRNQLLQYLNESQLVLTDMLNQCRNTPFAPKELELRTRKIHTLMQKKKYLQEDLSRIELAKAQSVCQRIDYLFYEIMQVPPDNACTSIERIQGMIRRDNLLLKIRLLEKDLTYTGEKEV